MRQVTAAPGTRGTGTRGTGRWIWGVSGLVTVVALAVPGAHLILNAGTPSVQENIAAIPTRAITITQPVTSLNVQSYGAPIQITTGSGSDVTVAEAISSSGDTSPAVTAQVTGGQLTLAAPACAQSNCSVGFTVTLPTGVPVTAASSGGDIIISGAAGASLDSGSGAVRATDITGSLGITSEGGPVLLDSVAGANVDSGGGVVQAARIYGQLTVSTEGGPVTVNGLTGALHADTGGGNLIAEGVSASTATVTTEGGDAQLGFAAAPDSVQVDTGGGAADLSVPGGPYALTADDGGGGPELISIATNPAATRSIIVSTDGGPLRIDAGTVGDSGPKAGGAGVRIGPPKPPALPVLPRPTTPPKP
jgi:putative adhesin